MRYLVIALLGLALVASPSAGATHPLRTGFLDPGAFGGPDASKSVVRARRAGSSVARLILFWSDAAPEPPAAPEDPNDPAYQWSTMDQQVIATVRGGLTPIVCITNSAPWAHGPAVGLPGNWPSPTKLGQFARAAALRYSGTFTPPGSTTPLPRVRFWEAWNEPNADSDLTPQRVHGRPATPAHYRLMVNAFAKAVKSVHAGNLVVAGTLGPFGHDSKDIQVVAPITFMSDLLCVSPQKPYRKTCSQRTRFDIWAQNPYTNGGPDWHVHSPSDVSIGELPKVKSLLLAARRHRTIIAPRAPDFWVTEFSWDTNPPDPRGIPLALDARWVSEGLYRMWSAGISTVVWFRLQDDPLRVSPYQSGFFTASGHAKSSLEAFRFPFVAFRTGSGVTIWGRTPSGTSAGVTVEQKVKGHWIRVRRVRADRYGIFSERLRLSAARTGALRAWIPSSSESSIPFSLTVPPTRPSSPFGCGGTIHC